MNVKWQNVVKQGNVILDRVCTNACQNAKTKKRGERKWAPRNCCESLIRNQTFQSLPFKFIILLIVAPHYKLLTNFSIFNVYIFSFGPISSFHLSVQTFLVVGLDLHMAGFMLPDFRACRTYLPRQWCWAPLAQRKTAAACCQ